MKTRPNILACLSLLLLAAAVIGETIHVTLAPGEALRLVIVTTAATQPAPPPLPPATLPADPPQPTVPAVPELAVSAVVLGELPHLSLRLQGPARDHAVKLHVRTKAASVLAGVLQPGDSVLLWPGSEAVPLRDGWEYWAWAVAVNDAGEARGEEVHIRLSVQLPPPATQPVPDGPVVLPPAGQIPEPPADALITADPKAFEAAANAGRPAVLEGASWSHMIRLRNIGQAWIRHSTGTMPAGAGGGWDRAHLVRVTGRGGELYIHDSTFSGQAGDAAIAVGWHRGKDYLDRYVIAHNDFIDLHEPVHVFGPHPSGPTVGVVANNYFRSIRRYGLEIQHGGASLLVQGNYYHKPWVNPASGHVRGPDVEFCSAAANETERVEILDNTSIFDSPSRWRDGDRNGYHIEAGGRQVLVRGNRMYGPGVAGVAALSTHNDAVKSQVTITGNTIAGVPEEAMGWGGPVIIDGGTRILNDWRADNDIRADVPAALPGRPAGVGRRPQ